MITIPSEEEHTAADTYCTVTLTTIKWIHEKINRSPEMAMPAPVWAPISHTWGVLFIGEMTNLRIVRERVYIYCHKQLYCQPNESSLSLKRKQRFSL